MAVSYCYQLKSTVIMCDVDVNVIENKFEPTALLQLLPVGRRLCFHRCFVA